MGAFGAGKREGLVLKDHSGYGVSWHGEEALREAGDPLDTVT